MIYLFLFILLFAAELFYFKVADRFNIIDKPNERSSHHTITLRGGGVIFYVGVLAFFLYSGFTYPWFFLGLTAITIISFLDDIYSVSNKLRISIHLMAVCLLFYELGFFSSFWWLILIGFILAIGTINAYNFMDGINGITAAYSLAVLLLFVVTNHQYQFVNGDLIYFSILATLVFAYFNFRKNAKCFAGDVGSVGMSFILVFLTLALILKTQNLLFILFFLVYGLDTVWTIVERLLKKENIFEAHRSHLYQYLSNEAGFDKLKVAAFYGLLQLLFGFAVLAISTMSTHVQIGYSLALILVLSAVYLIFKRWIKMKYVTGRNIHPIPRGNKVK